MQFCLTRVDDSCTSHDSGNILTESKTEQQNSGLSRFHHKKLH